MTNLKDASALGTAAPSIARAVPAAAAKKQDQQDDDEKQWHEVKTVTFRGRGIRRATLSLANGVPYLICTPVEAQPTM